MHIVQTAGVGSLLKDPMETEKKDTNRHQCCPKEKGASLIYKLYKIFDATVVYFCCCFVLLPFGLTAHSIIWRADRKYIVTPGLRRPFQKINISKANTTHIRDTKADHGFVFHGVKLYSSLHRSGVAGGLHIQERKN